ncbi:MAG: hypothetical protein JRH20_07750 [Deltaproteobacteria bacterium]|nr:hypothetical protein [Deltaproteobacteria bacterium]
MSTDSAQLFKIDQELDLGVGDAAYRVGSRRLVTQLLGGLKTLKDEAGNTCDLTLHIQLSLQVIKEPQPFAQIDERLAMGTNKASHRLGLRAMVEAIRKALEARIADEGDEHALVMHTLAVLEGR